MTTGLLESVRSLPPIATSISLTAIRINLGQGHLRSLLCVDDPVAASSQAGEWVSLDLENTTAQGMLLHHLVHLPYFPQTEHLNAMRLGDSISSAFKLLVQSQGVEHDTTAYEDVTRKYHEVTSRFPSARLPSAVYLAMLPPEVLAQFSTRWLAEEALRSWDNPRRES